MPWRDPGRRAARVCRGAGSGGDGSRSLIAVDARPAHLTHVMAVISSGMEEVAGLRTAGIDQDLGVVRLEVDDRHDEVALERLLDRVDRAAVVVVVNPGRWVAFPPRGGG
jgi:hypothetical protein